MPADLLIGFLWPRGAYQPSTGSGRTSQPAPSTLDAFRITVEVEILLSKYARCANKLKFQRAGLSRTKRKRLIFLLGEKQHLTAGLRVQEIWSTVHFKILRLIPASKSFSGPRQWEAPLERRSGSGTYGGRFHLHLLIGPADLLRDSL